MWWLRIMWPVLVWAVLSEAAQPPLGRLFRFERSLLQWPLLQLRNNNVSSGNYLNNNNNNNNNNNEDDERASSQCCACDEAKYELVFEALWSKHTHPDQFPENGELAKFGAVIGASHSAEFRMWQEDWPASDGVRELAETGATKKLEAELKQVSSKTRTIIKARELQSASPNSKTSAVFRTDRLHHLVSILSKLSPSPDWMVGVSGLELCLADCSWAQQRTLDLYLWDAGTDSGHTFEAPHSPQRPADKIRAIHAPAGSRRPTPVLAAGAGQPPEPAKPFARLTVTRQRIYEKSCPGEQPPTATMSLPAAPPAGSSLDWPSSEAAFNQLADCRLSEWSQWSACSSSCGKGLRTRTRSFLDPRAAHQFGCSRAAAELVAKEVCLSECQGSHTCVTRDWGPWSECSVSCGRGLRKRTRAPIERAGCEDVELAELEPCTGSQGLNCSSEPSSLAACQVGDWSHWSECSVACGKGTRIRTRQYLNRDSMERCGVKLLQKQACQGRPELCRHSTKVHSRTCSLPPDAGPCKAALTSWYFDRTTRVCSQFLYGGCLGNSNRFTSLQECQSACQTAASPPPPHNNNNSNNNKQRPSLVVKRSLNSNDYSSSSTPEPDYIHFRSLYELQNSSSLLIPKECLQTPDTRLGKLHLRRWYFDAEVGACLEFVWAGFPRRSNHFNRKQDCEHFCLAHKFQPPANVSLEAVDEFAEISQQKPVANDDYDDYKHEDSLYPNYAPVHVESDTQKAPNNNNKSSSIKQSQPQPPDELLPKLCHLAPVTGPCRAFLIRWRYDASEGFCKKFVYGGCDGNENRFNLKEKCENTCLNRKRAPMQPRDEAEPPQLPAKCLLPGSSGPCRALSIYWFHDRKSRTCKQFNYGGCEGNDNRFAHRDECERVCMVASGAVKSSSSIRN